MDTVARWVASLPGAFGRVTSFGTAPLLLATAGLLLIGLLKPPLRWSGVAFVVLAIVLAARTPVPDILVAADGRTFTVRGADGKLAFHHTGGDTFAMREWLAADADGREVTDHGLGEGITCDPLGCIGRLRDKRLVSHVPSPDAFEEDCRRAAVIVAIRDEPPDCAAMVIGRSLWRERGAIALRRDGTGFVIEFTRPPNFDRPWAPRPARSTGSDTAANSARRHARTGRRCHAATGGYPGGRLRRSIPAEQPDQLALDAHAVGRQDADLVGGIGRLERDRGAAAAEAFERGLLVVDQRHHDVAGIGGLAALDQRDVAVEDAGLDHRIAAHLEGEMLARREQIGRHVDDAGCVFWIASIGVPAAMRPITGTATGRPPSSSRRAARTRPRLPSITLGVKPRVRLRRCRGRPSRAA